MNPRNWAENDARREEGRERLDGAHGVPAGRRTRVIIGWVFAAAALALSAYAVLVLAGVVDVGQ